MGMALHQGTSLLIPHVYIRTAAYIRQETL